MKKITVTASLIAVLMFMSIMQAVAQIYYKPNEKAFELFNPYRNFKILNNTNKKDIEKVEKDMIKAIKLDSNFSMPYALLGYIKMNKSDFLSKQGSIFYFSKYLEKIKKYPTINSDENCKEFFNNSGNSGRCPDKVRTNRIECIIAAYRLTPEYFMSGENERCAYTPKELSTIINICINDLEAVIPIISADYMAFEYNKNGKEFVNRAVFDLYSLKGEIDFKRGDYSNSAQCYNLLIELLRDDYDSKLLIYNKLYELFMSIGDKISASSALGKYLDLYKKRGCDNCLGISRPSSLEFLNKRKQLILLINEINNLKSNDYEICKIGDKTVFCENENIKIGNSSSASQFWTIYNSNGLLDQYFDENGMFLNISPNYYYYTDDLYNFYLKEGKEQGMIWPKFKKTTIDKDIIGNSIIKDFLLCGCLNSMYDFDVENLIYTSQPPDSTLTSIAKLSDDWRTYNQIPVSYYNSKGQFVSQTVKSCDKLYQIEKQKYENEQALLMAQQQQQQQEVQRLQQEQNYKETQLRLIEEENSRKQKEIDLVNSKNQQIEKQKELESQKAATAFMKYMFQSPSSGSSSSSGGSTNSEPTRWTCKWCSKTMSEGYLHSFSAGMGKCVSSDNPSSYFPRYCSKKCAIEACNDENKNR